MATDQENLTPWAKRYGALPGTNKSGLTPIDYLFPAPVTAAQSQEVARIEQFQQLKFMGFTTRELGQLDTLCTRDLVSGNLSNGIISFLQRDSWERRPARPEFQRKHLYRLKNGSGKWVARNSEVWRILEPIVRLASRILMSTHLLPWFDALLVGERDDVPEFRLVGPDKTKYSHDPRQCFWRPKNPDHPDKAAIRRDQLFYDLFKRRRYTFGFRSPDEDPRGPKYMNDGPGVFGTTFLNHEEMETNRRPQSAWRLFTFINYKRMEQLLQPGLTGAERMSIQWNVANTIAHEVMHAISYSQELDTGRYSEPYFEDEAFSELGFSFESAINGGITMMFLQDELNEVNIGYWLKITWPCIVDQGVRGPDTPILQAPNPYNYEDMYPMPVSIFQDIQQEEFWDVGVRNYGHRLIYMKALTQGVRISYIITRDAGYNYSWTFSGSHRIKGEHLGTDHFTQVTGKINRLQSAMSLTGAERSALAFGQRFMNSSIIYEGFYNQSQEQTATINRVMSLFSVSPLSTSTQYVLFELIGLIGAATSNHELMVTATVSQEGLDQIEFADRRRNLLVWNRGTRIFIKELSKHIALRLPGFSVSKDILRLEQCRLFLFSPADASMTGSPDAQEIFAIKEAFRDLNNPTIIAGPNAKNDMRMACKALVDEPGASLFAGYVAGIIIACLKQDETENWDETVKQATVNANSLMQFSMGVPPLWKQEMDIWLNVARNFAPREFLNVSSLMGQLDK